MLNAIELEKEQRLPPSSGGGWAIGAWPIHTGDSPSEPVKGCREGIRPGPGILGGTDS